MTERKMDHRANFAARLPQGEAEGQLPNWGALACFNSRAGRLTECKNGLSVPEPPVGSLRPPLPRRQDSLLHPLWRARSRQIFGRTLAFLGRYGHHLPGCGLPLLVEEAYRTPEIELTSLPATLMLDSGLALRLQWQ